MSNVQLLYGDCLKVMSTMEEGAVDAIVTDPPYGISMMGNQWDHSVPGTPFWKEALRVAKPGAHLLAFGGTRTYHRLVCAIEDAGWEIRDCLMWVYGSGWPKSLDVAKAIDKAKGFKGKVVGTRRVDVSMQGGSLIRGGHKRNEVEQEVRELSEEAARWSGYGTALKPAYEPIVLARKPISEKSIAENVLKHGVGAINIDACRVPSAKGAGRFPANLIHDGSSDVLQLFPESRGQQGAVTGDEPSETTRGVYGKFSGNRKVSVPRGDSGSAARFFYCAKASREERGQYNTHVSVKPLALMRYLVTLVAPEKATILDPFMGSGSTGVACVQTGNSFVGIEMDAEYYEIAQRRISEECVKPPHRKE